MMINPIIPVWLMGIICVILLFLRKERRAAYIRQIVMIGLLFLINLRIMLPDDTVTVTTKSMNTKVLFVIDDTISMVAKDDGNRERLEQVKDDCSYILQELNGARFAVVSFNNEAHYLAPYTNNTEYIAGVIQAIYPLNDLYAKGSSMNIWRTMASDILRNAEEDNSGDVVLFFLSDGEITNDEQLESFADLKKYVDYGAVMGYGTSEGGQMEIKDFLDGETKIIEDQREYPYKPAVSKMDEGNLKKIAKDIGIDYVHMDTSTDIDSVLNTIKRNAKTKTQDKKEQGHKDIYYVFAVPFLLLLMFEFYDMRKRVRMI